MDLFNPRNSTYALCTTLFVFAVIPVVSATTRNVPGSYANIQSAVDAANVGDTVLVSDGIYSGPGNRDIDLGGKDLVIKSVGGAGTCSIDCEGSELEPHRGFLLQNGESSATIIEGFTIENGWGPIFNYVDGIDTIPVSIGGAIACLGASPTLRGLSLSNNTAYAGGGIICAFGSTANIQDCEFDGNTAYWVDEFADGSGGAVFSFIADITISRCVFTYNTSNFKGGAISIDSDEGSTISIDSCIFAYNVGDSSGGAIDAYMTTANITNSLFLSNSSGAIGGAIYAEQTLATTTVTNCTFVENAITGGNGYGSAIYAEYGGAIAISQCILTENTGGSVTIGCEDSTSLAISCTDIWNNSPGDWVDCLTGGESGNNNLSADPQYCLDTPLDYSIATSSPCAATNSPCGSLIGAFGTACAEPPSCCDVPGDVNNDAKIGIGDVTYLIARLFTGGPAPECCASADADGGGSMTIGDVTRIIGYIFTGGTAPVCGATGISCSQG